MSAGRLMRDTWVSCCVAMGAAMPSPVGTPERGHADVDSPRGTMRRAESGAERVDQRSSNPPGRADARLALRTYVRIKWRDDRRDDHTRGADLVVHGRGPRVRWTTQHWRGSTALCWSSGRDWTRHGCGSSPRWGSGRPSGRTARGTRCRGWHGGPASGGLSARQRAGAGGGCRGDARRRDRPRGRRAVQSQGGRARTGRWRGCDRAVGARRGSDRPDGRGGGTGRRPLGARASHDGGGAADVAPVHADRGGHTGGGGARHGGGRVGPGRRRRRRGPAGAAGSCRGPSAGRGDSSRSAATSSTTPTCPTRRHGRPTVVVTIELDALAARTGGSARLDSGAYLRGDAARRLACDAGVVRLLTDPDSMPLDVGRLTRSIAPAQARAVIHRDQHCRYEGCHSPPWACEIHHLDHWSRGGRTDLERLGLLCWHHHHLTHLQEATHELVDVGEGRLRLEPRRRGQHSDAA